MAIKTVRSYEYQAKQTEEDITFKVTSISLDTSCVANESELIDVYKIFWIERGSGRYYVDFQPYTIDGGGIFFLSPGQVFTVDGEKVEHGYQIAFDKEFYCVETQGKEIACNGMLFNNIHRSSLIVPNDKELKQFSFIVENMVEELQNPGKAHREMLETYLRWFLIQAIRTTTYQHIDLRQAGEEANRLASDFIALVEKHYKQIHGVTDYADLLGISAKSLAKRLHLTGYKKPTEIIRDRLVLQAKRNLRYTNLSVKEIAFDIGFDDPAYFTRFFKKANQESPMEYRSHYQ
ncbi:AraC family transcriptional regulator [Fulvivirgaceae bacterium BMA10]|uniref:AraC family transcriptional regulator n=1 Tax=Splendidivirga corallicola TaxID=3051826 RepID=A0ABT8KMT0_9BACT|nr:AraC family transcriptional regulator [Fulvivirgaceae bacterium BMA10]